MTAGKGPIIHVVPIGTNIGNNPASKHYFPEGLRNPKKNFDINTEIHISTLVRDYLGDQSSDSATELQQLFNTAKPEDWPRDSSSEIRTLTTFTQCITQPYLPADQSALLITSDYDEIVMAALLTALIITNNNRSRIRYLHEPQIDLQNLPGNVFIVRIPTLDVHNEKEFERASAQLGLLGRGLLDLSEPDEARKPHFRFSLTGGYRATVPYLAAIAETLLGCPKHVGSVKASILHESQGIAEETGHVTPIPYPLRPLDYEILRHELDAVMAPETEQPRAGYRLEGYAYVFDAHQKCHKLTPLGMGLREMVKHHPEL